MSYDLLIKNGMVIDGSGGPRYRADVGIQDGKIVTLGRIRGEAAKQVIDAEGHVVSPGFVDGHTHMDAQIFWDTLGFLLLLSRRHQCRDGQLRFHTGALPRGGSRLRVPQPGAGRGYQPRSDVEWH